MSPMSGASMAGRAIRDCVAVCDDRVIAAGCVVSATANSQPAPQTSMLPLSLDPRRRWLVICSPTSNAFLP